MNSKGEGEEEGVELPMISIERKQIAGDAVTTDLVTTAAVRCNAYGDLYISTLLNLFAPDDHVI